MNTVYYNNVYIYIYIYIYIIIIIIIFIHQNLIYISYTIQIADTNAFGPWTPREVIDLYIYK